MLRLLTVLGSLVASVVLAPGLPAAHASTTPSLSPDAAGGTLSGMVIPPQDTALNLFFERTDTAEIIVHRIEPGQPGYSATVPSGTYYAYAWLPDLSGVGGFTTCVSDPACRERSLVPIAVTSGEVRSGVDIADWHAPETRPLVIRGRLIDGTGTGPMDDAVVAIGGRHVVAVGPASELAISDHVDVLDMPGATILPGFINAHVHNVFDSIHAAAWAYEGVTTVRDVGTPVHSPWDSLRAALEPYPRHTRILAAGPLVTCPGGYPIVPNNFASLVVRTAREAHDEINRLIDRGADVIKIAIASSVGPVLSPELTVVIVETAHARGIPVTAHVSLTSDLRRALDAGVDDVSHMVRDRLPDDLIRRMVETDVACVPTLAVSVGTGTKLRNLQRFVRAGGRVALGNDAGYIPEMTVGMPVDEIRWMQLAGMTPMEIVLAATRDAAIVCERERMLGTLQLGKLADVLVVGADPLQDLRALEDVRLVVHGGVVIRQE